MGRYPSSVLLDSNLLLLLAVGLFDSRLIGRKRLDEFTSRDFELLGDLIAVFPVNLTTPHLLAEVNNLADQCVPRQLHRDFRLFLRDFFKGFDERWMKSTELSTTDAFLWLGLSDAAVCQLADENVAVYSVDLELVIVLQGLGLNATNFNHLR
jgi:hypothetical protein